MIEARLEDPNATLEDIGIQAGYSGTTPRQKAHRALKSEDVQKTLREEMEADPALCRKARLKKLREGLRASKTSYFQFNGNVTDQRRSVDYPTRKSYLELADKLCGDLTDKHEIVFDGPMPFKMVYSDEQGGEAPQVPKPSDKGES